jgi:hypothetical protein
MALLGFDYREAQRREIGSRYEHSSRKAPIDVFLQRMAPSIRNVARMLKPSKLAYFFVGDSVLGGKLYPMDSVYEDLVGQAGLKVVAAVEYDLANVSRSFRDTRDAAGNKHALPKKQRILVVEGTRPRGLLAPSRVAASPRSRDEPCPLSRHIPDGKVIALESDESDRHVHSLVQFPSKFIPEIPRWVLADFSQEGDVVLDPFGGSGTTAVEAVITNRDAITVDVSPYASLLSEAKSCLLEPRDLLRNSDVLARAASGGLPTTPRIQFPRDSFGSTWTILMSSLVSFQ